MLMQDNDVAKKNSQFREIMKRLAKNRLAVAGLVVIILLIILAFLAPVISPYPYEEAHLTDKLQKPSAAYIFGTDELGRDIFSMTVIRQQIFFKNRTYSCFDFCFGRYFLRFPCRIFWGKGGFAHHASS